VLSKCVIMLVVLYIWKCSITDIVHFVQSLISFGQKQRLKILPENKQLLGLFSFQRGV
jgi:hypothetical protein